MEMHEMGRGIDMRAQALCLEHRAAERTDGTFAICPGDVHHRRQLVLRVTKRREQPFDAVQNEIDPLGMKRQEPFENRIAFCDDCHTGVSPLPRTFGPFVLVGLAVRTGAVHFDSERGCFITRCTRRESVSRKSCRCTTISIMPCSSRYSARWNPSGNRSRIVCSITRCPVKPISAPGSAMCTSPSIAYEALTPPVVGSVSTTT